MREAPGPRLLHAVAARLDDLANGSKTLQQQLGALQLANDELTAASGAVATLLDLDGELAFGAASAPGFLPAVTGAHHTLARGRAALARLLRVSAGRRGSDVMRPSTRSCATMQTAS
jgi:hypothetical protein